MSRGIGHAVRLIAGITLLILAVSAVRGPGFVRLLTGAEIAAATSCLPGVWRLGGVGLLAILGIAFTHHAIAGQFAPAPLFAMLVVILEVAHERL